MCVRVCIFVTNLFHNKGAITPQRQTDEDPGDPGNPPSLRVPNTCGHTSRWQLLAQPSRKTVRVPKWRQKSESPREPEATGGWPPPEASHPGTSHQCPGPQVPKSFSCTWTFQREAWLRWRSSIKTQAHKRRLMATYVTLLIHTKEACCKTTPLCAPLVDMLKPEQLRPRFCVQSYQLSQQQTVEWHWNQLI